jgi:hypothetical protein
VYEIERAHVWVYECSCMDVLIMSIKASLLISHTQTPPPTHTHTYIPYTRTYTHTRTYRCLVYAASQFFLYFATRFSEGTLARVVKKCRNVCCLAREWDRYKCKADVHTHGWVYMCFTPHVLLTYRHTNTHTQGVLSHTILHMLRHTHNPPYWVLEAGQLPGQVFFLDL